MMSYIMKYGYIHFGFKFMNGIRQSTCIRFPVWKPWGFPYVGFLEDIRKCENVDSIGKHLTWLGWKIPEKYGKNRLQIFRPCRCLFRVWPLLQHGGGGHISMCIYYNTVIMTIA